MEWVDLGQLLYIKILIVRHRGGSVGWYLANLTSPIAPSPYCAVTILFQSVPVYQLS